MIIDGIGERIARGGTMTRCIAAAVSATAVCGAGHAATDAGLEAYLKAHARYRYQEVQSPSVYFKDISRVKVHWLKPKENADGTVTLKWEPPAAEAVSRHLLDTAWISVADAATGKEAGRFSAALAKRSAAYRFPAFGNYTLAIWASNKYGKTTARTSFAYTARKYVPPVTSKETLALVADLYAFTKARETEIGAAGKSADEKAAALVKLVAEWAAGKPRVRRAELAADWQGVSVVLGDYRTIYVRLETRRLFGDDGENPYVTDVTPPDLRDEPAWPDIEIAVPPPVVPASRKAVVFHGLGIDEMGAGYPRAAVEDGLRGAGFDDLTVVESDDEDAIAKLARIDDEQYGFVYYQHHGAVALDDLGEPSLAVGIAPYYDWEPEVEHLGVVVAHQEILGRVRCYRVFTRRFIDTYCGDMPFPRTFFYWYSCATGLDHPVVDALALDVAEKGAICGWVGMDNVDADIADNNIATRFFFSALPEKPYLSDAVARANTAGDGGPGRGSDLRLLQEGATGYNRAFFIDRDFADLGIRRVEQARGGLFSIVVGNEGTLAPPAGTEIVVGCKGLAPGAPYAQTSAVTVPEHLWQGEEFEVLIPPAAGVDGRVGLDIEGALPDDAAPANNIRLAHAAEFLPDLVAVSCARLDNGAVAVTIENRGLNRVENIPHNEIFVDATWAGQGGAVRVPARFGNWQLPAGGSCTAEIAVPAGVAAVTITADSTGLVREFDERNTAFLGVAF